MDNVCNVLHNHSALERLIGFDKNLVLIDEEYKNLFIDNDFTRLRKYTHNKKVYYAVPILGFVKKGGKFKNFAE